MVFCASCHFNQAFLVFYSIIGSGDYWLIFGFFFTFFTIKELFRNGKQIT